MRTVYFDGQYLKAGTRIIEAFTPGFFKAKGVFETMLGLDGVVLDASLHLERLLSGLKALGIRPPPLNALLLKEVLRRNRLSTARVRAMVWQAGREVHVMAVALPYEAPERKNYRVCLFRTGRRADDRLAGVKSLDYGLFAKAFALARAKGFDEALLLNRRGHIFEAGRANIFWIKDRVLYTPPLSSGCLSGITRRQVIDSTRRLKVPVQERDLTPQILKAADAAFLTNSLIGIKPIEIPSIGAAAIKKID